MAIGGLIIVLTSIIYNPNLKSVFLITYCSRPLSHAFYTVVNKNTAVSASYSACLSLNVMIKRTTSYIKKLLLQSRLLDKKCGTVQYMSPEILQGRQYRAEPVDVWACGIVLVAMLAGGKSTKAFLYCMSIGGSGESVLSTIGS